MVKGQTQGKNNKTFTVDIQHNPYDIECCIAIVREHPHLIVHGVDEEDAKSNIKDLIRCHLDCEEGEGAGGAQTFTCIYHHV